MGKQWDKRHDEQPSFDGAQDDGRSIIGRHSVLEAYRSGVTIDRLFVQKGLNDGPVLTILREAKKRGTTVDFVDKVRLDRMAPAAKHQGVIAYGAAASYASVEEILALAEERGEAPFVFILDHIQDPHNLGAIIRTAHQAGAHGVIIPSRRSATLTATAAKASAGAVYHTLIAQVTNLSRTIEDLKEKGLWFVCADMGGTLMYELDMTGPIGLVIGNEGEGVSQKIREACDFIASIPMRGQIDSLNASVAAGVLGYEIVRQRLCR